MNKKRMAFVCELMLRTSTQLNATNGVLVGLLGVVLKLILRGKLMIDHGVYHHYLHASWILSCHDSVLGAPVACHFQGYPASNWFHAHPAHGMWLRNPALRGGLSHYSYRMGPRRYGRWFTIHYNPHEYYSYIYHF